MLLVFLWLASQAVAEAPPDWHRIQDDEAGFAVELPGLPTRHYTSQLTLVGRIPTEMVSASEAGAEFRIEVHGIPAIARWILSEESLVERAAADFLEAEEAVSSDSEKRRIGSRPGLRVSYRDAQRRSGEARFALVRGRLYMQVCLGAPGGAAPRGRERFFESFTLLPAADAPE